MVKLLAEDIRTHEVLQWQGIHLFHSDQSSCSQKLRIFLNLKGIEWQRHHIDLLANENISEWYLGINPRGLVPTLVHDGDVHIESNDILLYLETLFPQPCLVPSASADKIAELLQHEDDLHLDFRSLTFRFVFNPPTTPKTPDVMDVYHQAGSGTVNGAPDTGKAEQLQFWDHYAQHGIPDDHARAAARRLRSAFDGLEHSLANSRYLLGNSLTVVDIAWFIYVNRLSLAGYPFERLHPQLDNWFERLMEMPEFGGEVGVPDGMLAGIKATRAANEATGRTLAEVAGL